MVTNRSGTVAVSSMAATRMTPPPSRKLMRDGTSFGPRPPGAFGSADSGDVVG